MRSQLFAAALCAAFILVSANPGAYCSTTSKQLSANALRAASSHVPPRSAYGAYWQNIDIRCFPGGATVASMADGIVHSTIGSCDGRPYFASSYPRSM